MAGDFCLFSDRYQRNVSCTFPRSGGNRSVKRDQASTTMYSERQKINVRQLPGTADLPPFDAFQVEETDIVGPELVPGCFA